MLDQSNKAIASSLATKQAGANLIDDILASLPVIEPAVAVNDPSDVPLEKRSPDGRAERTFLEDIMAYKNSIWTQAVGNL